MNKYKMYIFVKDSLSNGFAIVSASHAALATFLKYDGDADMSVWLDESFRKVVCVVNDDEFARAKLVDKSVVLTESALDGQEVAIGFCPRQREDWPEWFRQLPLFN